jgi:hypothetical protein
VLFKVRVIFKQYIPNKNKSFGIKIYKLSNSLEYTYNMTVYLGKDRKHATRTMTATHTTVIGLMRRTENAGHKLYMDNFFSPPELLDNLHTKNINCCGTVRPNKKECLGTLERHANCNKVTISRVRGYLTSILWKN